MELPWAPELSAGVRAGLASRIRPGWQLDAACAEDDPTLFDEPTERGDGPERAAVARSICHDCPVRTACLAAGLLGDEWGIWGGHDSASRDAIRHALADPRRRLAVLGPGFNQDGTPITHHDQEAA